MFILLGNILGCTNLHKILYILLRSVWIISVPSFKNGFVERLGTIIM